MSACRNPIQQTRNQRAFVKLASSRIGCVLMIPRSSSVRRPAVSSQFKQLQRDKLQPLAGGLLECLALLDAQRTAHSVFNDRSYEFRELTCVHRVEVAHASARDWWVELFCPVI